MDEVAMGNGDLKVDYLCIIVLLAKFVGFI